MVCNREYRRDLRARMKGCRMIDDTRMALVILALFAFGFFLLAVYP
jgi:hypothetical protein